MFLHIAHTCKPLDVDQSFLYPTLLVRNVQPRERERKRERMRERARARARARARDRERESKRGREEESKRECEREEHFSFTFGSYKFRVQWPVLQTYGSPETWAKRERTEHWFVGTRVSLSWWINRDEIKMSTHTRHVSCSFNIRLSVVCLAHIPSALMFRFALPHSLFLPPCILACSSHLNFLYMETVGCVPHKDIAAHSCHWKTVDIRFGIA